MGEDRPSRLGPLWLPHGSVRAILALGVVFVTCWLTVHGEPVPVAVSEALFTGLAYYFATRGLMRLTPEEAERLRAERGEAEQFNPLFLPRGTIRVLIVLAFVGLAGYLLAEEGVRGLASATTLLLVLAFFAGQVLKYAVRWLSAKRERRRTLAFEHVKAALGLAVAAGFIALFVTGYHREAHPAVHKGFLAFMIFYFGSR